MTFVKKNQEVKDLKEVKDVKPEEIKVENLAQEVKEPQTFVVKTELDAYINDRLKGQPQTLSEIEVKDVQDDSVASHLLKLPPQIQKAFDERNLTPRWISKKKRAIDHALDVRGWVIFNRTFFPKLPKHFFSANGTFEIGDLILGCMPAQKAELLRKRPGQISQERIKNLPIEAYKNSKGEEKIGYYKPAYTAEPDGEMAKREAGLFAQPDVQNLNE